MNTIKNHRATKRSHGLALAALLLTLTMVAGCAQSTGSTSAAATGTKAGTTTLTTAVATAVTTPGTTSATQGTAGLELTLEELAKYDGQEGRPAYVAVDGIIYDVTNVKPWAGGKHNGFQAGKDLTKEIKTVSPHGVSRLQGVSQVGRIKE